MIGYKLSQVLGLLVGLEWGVKVYFDSPNYLEGDNKGKRFKILCKSVEHAHGYLPRIGGDKDTTNLMIYITNKSGNNLILLNNATTKKLMRNPLKLREVAQGIVYKNEIELQKHDLPRKG